MSCLVVINDAKMENANSDQDKQTDRNNTERTLDPPAASCESWRCTCTCTLSCVSCDIEQIPNLTLRKVAVRKEVL